MRKLLISELLITLFLTSSLSFAEEGLFKIKDTKVPGSIEIASESVLQMVLLGEPAQQIPAASYAAYLNANAAENFVLSLTIQKIKSCQQEGRAFCEVKFKSYGSAFITDDGRTLWTAKHVVAPQLGGKLNFQLYNGDGEMLFDSSDSKDQVSIVFVGDGNLIQKRHEKEFIIDDGMKQLSSDYVKLRLNRDLPVRPLRISARQPEVNQRVFAAGYANVSGYRTMATLGGNTKTRSRVAIGIVRPYSEALPNETPAQKQSRLAMENFTSQHLLIMDMDGLPGQSGSPVFNESGEVIGIFVAGNSTISDRGALRGLAPHFAGIAANGH